MNFNIEENEENTISHCDPQVESVVKRIFDIASTQFEDGSCYHQYQPLTKKGNAAIGGDFNDDQRNFECE